MKTTDVTQKELTQMKRANTIELKQLKEILQEINEASHSQRSKPIMKRYYLGDSLWLRRLQTQNEIETCEFRILKYERMQNELNANK
jgi:hypothetical protein